MITKIVVSRGIVAKTFCMLGICLMATTGSIAVSQNSVSAESNGAAPVVKGSMKYGNATVTYIDAAAGIWKGNGNIVIHLDNEKIDRGEVTKKLREDGMVASSNKLEFAFDSKGKLRNYSYQWSEGSTSRSGGSLSPDGLMSKVTISKTRATGRVYTKKPLQDFDEKYTFDVTFDVEI
jgi:hypothetical protein